MKLDTEVDSLYKNMNCKWHFRDHLILTLLFLLVQVPGFPLLRLRLSV
jgi:hypothetical protein